ncbi:MAG: Stp1/IreP family PP2C-type Ser/Thr phosphatase [Lachnospiraceae bacterium]|jgi:serine/threonine protein phosphatase PrpC|nr:Stp1/IreP family PP2C-type Ser/Thr phosphatase [Lachnospiraceae bacterium]MCI1726493.1 Stp1/IreP family PP2C-type Ser/Thr phosphatase [Lachnospiraceae bacterium]
MRAFSETDVGQKRKINQDSIFASETPVGNLPNLFIVADGMGGHNAGDFASKFAVRTIKESIENSREKNPVKLIGDAIRLANSGILEKAAEHEEMAGMGTTVVVTTIIDQYAYTANVGDSRLYVLEDGELRQITQDHSLVQEMVRLGELSAEEARNHPDKHIITRALGAAPTVEIDFFDFKAPPESEILMCSDGLSNMVDDSEIRNVLNGMEPAKDKVGRLIREANDNGGKDNIAVIVIEPDSNEVDESC